jgi:[ribosomal protein S5]-alanine N-acetyltransferase
MKKLNRKTRRLHIRPMEAEDFIAWRTAHLGMSKSRNTWDLGAKPEKDLTLTQFKKILSEQAEQRKKNTFYSLGVFDSAGSLIGGVSIMEVIRGISHTAYLGYRIFNNYWGLGYGKEAVQAVIDIGFRDIKLHRIEAGIEPRNSRSIRLAKALGMRREGLKKRAIFLRNQWVDLLMYTLTCEDIGLKFRTSNLRIKSRS